MRMFQAHDLNRVTCVRFSPDAQTLTVGVRRQTLATHIDLVGGESRVWDRFDEGVPTDFAYSVDGRVLVVTIFDGISRSTDAYTRHGDSSHATTFEYMAHLPGMAPRDDMPVSLVFAPTTHLSWGWLACSGESVHLWNPHTREHIYSPEEGDYRGVAFGPDGTTVTSIEYHAHAVCVWNVKPFRVLFRTDLKGVDTFDNGSVAMMPDGERVIVAAGNVLRCVPINGGTGWDSVTKKPPQEIALHPSGRTLLVVDGSKKVTAYDTDNGKVSAQYDWGIGKVGCVTYSLDGTLAAAGGEKGQVAVWDAE